MKKFWLLIALACSLVAVDVAIVHHAHADIQGAPFIPEIDKRFDALEQGNHFKTGVYPSGAADGHWVKQLAVATYDFAKYTGAIGTYSLGTGLPKNAVITESWLYSITKPTTSASGTLAFKCQNTGDILAATAAGSFAAAGASLDGVSTGATAANFKYTTAACTMQAVIATGALTAGKVSAFVEYMVHQ